MMNKVTRNEFRHNFLKSIVVRLDFQGVFDPEMGNILAHIKPLAKENGFTRYSEGVAQIDVAVSGKIIKDCVETTNNVSLQKIYSFINEDRGFHLNVSSRFISLAINTAHYVPFEEYRSLVPSVSNVFKETIDYYSVTRFGIRKINECLIEDKTKIREYFNPTFFSYYDGMENLTTLQSNRVDIFTFGKYHINLMTGIARGQVEQKTTHSVRLDLDAYLNDVEEIQKLLSEQEKQDEINNLLFEIYLSTLTNEFIDMLKSDDDFDASLILGVERND